MCKKCAFSLQTVADCSERVFFCDISELHQEFGKSHFLYLQTQQDFTPESIYFCLIVTVKVKGIVTHVLKWSSKPVFLHLYQYQPQLLFGFRSCILHEVMVADGRYWICRKKFFEIVFHSLFVFLYRLLNIHSVSIMLQDDTGYTIQQTTQLQRHLKVQQLYFPEKWFI